MIMDENAKSVLNELERARTELQWHRSLVAASSDLIALVDATYTFRAVNRAYLEAHALREDEVLGHTVADVFGDKVFEKKLKPRFDQCLAGEKVNLQFWWPSPTLGRRHVDARYNPFYETDGSVTGVVVDARDTTEQRQAEQLLERTVAALEKANQELEAFSDSLVHDLKSPLMTVTQFTDYLDEALGDSLDEQLEDYLRRIQSAGRHMTHIIDDLRALTDVRRQEVRRNEVDLSAMGRQIIDELIALVPGRTVTFEVEPGIKSVGDPSLVRILVTNLIQNSWKYTRPKPDARIELGVERDSDGFPTYFVRDNGIGFDNADRGRIFRAFERLHSARDFAGSGLGLSTVDRIVRRHGGRVWAEGVPGEGAVFRFTLEPPTTDIEQVERRIGRLVTEGGKAVDYP